MTIWWPSGWPAPVEVFIEQFSAHPLEQDAAQLYAPPDGFLDVDGIFHKQRQSPQDKPVYRVTLNPEDGPYLLPYMALQASGDPWDDDCALPWGARRPVPAALLPGCLSNF